MSVRSSSSKGNRGKKLAKCISRRSSTKDNKLAWVISSSSKDNKLA
jgi:hypothetical protein